MGWAPSGQHGIRLRADTDARSGAALYGEVVRATRRWGPWAIAAAWTVTAVAVTAAATIAPARTFGDPAVITAVLVGVVPLALSVVLARRAAGHPAGPLLAAAGSVLIVMSLPLGADAGPFAGTWTLLYLPFAVLLVLLPDGRAASPRWRAVAWAVTGVAVAFALAAAAETLSVPRTLLEVVAMALLVAFLALLVACAAAPIARYGRSDERARMRLRWIYVVGMTLPFTLLLCWASYLVLGTPDLVALGIGLMYLLLPAGVAVAIVRPNLFDIDRAAVAAVTAASLVVAALVVLSAVAAVAGVTMLDWPAATAIGVTAMLTMAAAIAYPWLRRAVERMLYPERGRALAALEQLAAGVDTGDAQPEEVEAVLRATLRDPGLVVGIRPLGGGPLVGLDGEPVPVAETTTDVTVRGESIGAIVPSSARAKRPAVAVARATAPLVDAVRLQAALRRATAEVEASRARLLSAGHEERRRLERDLHDGAQQRLVALGMRLRVLQRTSAPDAQTAAALDGAVAELGTAVAELRRLAHGVRPSLLDDGLDAALADMTRRAPSAIELDVRAAELPDIVATTAYFVVSEAVANALRHAAASRIRVSVRDDAGVLRVRVEDDGRGGAALRPEGGLTGLADRVGALGGEFSVSSRRGEGTTVEARIPCAWS